MKKIFNFLKSPLMISAMVIGGIYLFWLLTTTTDSRSIHSFLRHVDSYIAGLVIFGVYIFIVAIKYRGNKSFKWGYIAIAILFTVYTRWFQLIPSVLEENGYPDPSPSYIAGIILFIIYVIFLILVRAAKKKPVLRAFFLIPTILVLCLNLVFVWIFFPVLSITARCNGTKYYISEFSPLSDAQWNYWQLTKWKGIFNYESHFLGNSGVSKIVCDKKNGQTNIVSGPGVLAETDGENPRNFDEYAWTDLGNRQYFLARDRFLPEGCNIEESCDKVIYTLYACNLDYAACNPLPIQYVGDHIDFAVLEADEIDNKISLYDDYDDNPDRTLFFTYGKNPRCYVDGCKILDR